MGTLLGTIARGARGLGLNMAPLAAFKRCGGLWDRIMHGGRCTILRQGEKEVWIDIDGVPMVRYRYYRTAYMGMIRNAGHFFADKCEVNMLHFSATGASVQFNWE